MFHGASHRHIQFAVHDAAVRVHEDVTGQELQLVVLLHRETVDDVLTLRPLVTFHRVDGDVVQRRNSPFVDGVSDGGNLVAVGDDDAQRVERLECRLALQEIDFVRQSTYHVCLRLVYFVRRRVGRCLGCHEGEPPHFQ